MCVCSFTFKFLFCLHVQISHIPHPHILNFIAAEIIQRNSQTLHYLICEYHERGTLFDHLKSTPVDVHGLLVLAESIAAGLAHLHSEIPNNQGVLVKPAVAHCNLTSKSIYIKLDGKPLSIIELRTSCLAMSESCQL